MASETPSADVSPAALWTGRVLSVLPALMLIASAVAKFYMASNPPAETAPPDPSGWPAYFMVPLGIVELASTILYLIPRTSVVGAILLTGYMGGAIATHLRIEDPPIIQIILPILLWLGLYLRDARLRTLIPFRM